MHELYGLNISPATICAWIEAAAERVAPSVEAIKESIQAAPVVGADESGLRVDGKLQWLHTAVTPPLTWYGVHAKRGMEAIQELDVLAHCTGRLVHDCFAPYYNLVDKEHSLCGAHLLRELAYEQQLSSQRSGSWECAPRRQTTARTVLLPYGIPWPQLSRRNPHSLRDEYRSEKEKA